ncbi:MAG: hypothetical protein ACI92Z_003493 [Paracoccaceae bacterium]|jgi:hypothetical protein
MADLPPLHIRAHETGVIRIFAMDMPAQQARFHTEPVAMQQVLGANDIDPAYVEIFPVADLDQLGLAGYLVEGCGIPASLVAPERDRLNAVTGYVMLVHSRAFGGRAVTLTPTLPLIATFNDPGTDWSGEKIETESAKLYTSTRPPPRQIRAAARRSGAIVFTVFMLIVAAIILMVVL